jgi:hypothetical protein
MGVEQGRESEPTGGAQAMREFPYCEKEAMISIISLSECGMTNLRPVILFRSGCVKKNYRPAQIRFDYLTHAFTCSVMRYSRCPTSEHWQVKVDQASAKAEMHCQWLPRLLQLLTCILIWTVSLPSKMLCKAISELW